MCVEDAQEAKSHATVTTQPSTAAHAQQNNDDTHWMRCVMTLDDQSSASLHSNVELASNIHTINETLRVHANAGNMGTSQVADAQQLGEVWFDNERATANIIAWKQLQNHPDYRMGHDCDQDQFTVTHLPTQTKIAFFEH